jgi:hypothetical protein
LDNLNRYFYEEKVSQVKNKALLGNHTFPLLVNGHPIPGTQIEGSQSHEEVEGHIGNSYRVVKKVNGNLLTSPWSSEVPGANFIWLTTHGTPDIYEMENGAGISDDPTGSPGTHGNWVRSAMGGGVTPTPDYPPYNVPATPPCNFMFIDTCCTLTADFSEVLFPHFNAYAGLGCYGYDLNQFVAGWKVKLAASEAERVAISLCEPLFAGRSAYSSILLMILHLQASSVCLFGTSTLVDITHVGYHGDVYARVKGVYTASPGIETDWYKSL